jgi:hypothetical protein
MSLADRIISAESGGNANARNPRSSATGLSQFIDSTWLAMISKHRPDLAEGKSREEVLALRTDPALSRQMTEAYAAENAGVLTKSGLPVTPGTQYLAHFAGPQGAVGVLSADPSLPVGSVLGEAAVRANPFLAKMTAGELAAWADRKVGAPMSVAPAPAVPATTAAPTPMATPQAAPQAPFAMSPQASQSASLAVPESDAPKLPPLSLFLSKRRPAPRGGLFLS